MSRLGQLIRRSAGTSSGGGTPVVPVPEGTRLSAYYGSMLNDPTAVIDIGAPPSGSPGWIWDMDINVDTLTFSGLMYDDRAIPNLTLNAREGLYHGAGSQLLVGRENDLATGRTIISREYMFNGLSTLWGAHPVHHRSRLSVTLNQGDTVAYVRDDVSDWKAGDKVCIWHTDYFGQRTPFEFILPADASAGSIPLPTGGAPYKFWGSLQFLQNATFGAPGANAISLTQPSSVTTPVGYQGRTVADHSACIVNLSRRGIEVNGPNDGGDNGHTMAMKPGRYQWTGYRQRYMGRPILAHYPTHEHLLSQNDAGTADIGAVTDSWRKFGVVEGSPNKAFVWHGTRGSVIHDCIAYNVTRMNFFGEDGYTQDYDLQRNVSLGAKSAANDASLFRKFDARVAGFWLSHPQGVFKDNWVLGSDRIGEWDAFSDRCFALSVNMPRLGPEYLVLTDDGAVDYATTKMTPARLGNVEGSRTGNYYFGCGEDAIDRNSSQSDDDGNTAITTFSPSRNQVNRSFFDFRGAEIAKCPFGYVNRVQGQPGPHGEQIGGANYKDLVVSDCYYFGLVGSASGVASDLLLIGRTENHGTPPATEYPAPMSSYEGSLLPTNSIFANYGGSTPEFNFYPHGFPYSKTGIQFYDVYVSGILDWMSRSTGMVFHNSLMGYRVPSGLVAREVPSEYSTLNKNGVTFVDDPTNNDNQSWWQGVLEDKLHYMGPYDSWCFKRPMFTHGSTFVDAPGEHNGVKVDRYFMGIRPAGTDQEPYIGDVPVVKQSFRMIRHPDTDLTDTVIDTMTRPTLPSLDAPFSRLANLSVANGGRYTFSLPSNRASSKLYLSLQRFSDTTKWIHLQIEWDGTKTVSTPNIVRGNTWTAKTSKADVNASSTNAWWQDKANNLLHLKIFGAPITDFDASLYPNNTTFGATRLLTLTAS